MAILDADKEGFLRSETSLIQTIGRAARNSSGRVIMYADVVTDSMRRAIDETERRRMIQEDYNKKHGIIPKTIEKKVYEIIQATKSVTEKEQFGLKKDIESMNKDEIEKEVKRLDKEMKAAARDLQFERAAQLRDIIIEMKKSLI